MKLLAPLLALSCLGLAAQAWAQPAHHGHHMPAPAPPAEAPAAPAVPGLTLDRLLAMAMAKNPALAALQGGQEAAQGRALQAGLHPNPHLGYKVEELGARGPSRSGAHYLFLEQRLVTGGKLELAQEEAALEAASLQDRGRAARSALLASVAAAYHQALAAQRVLEARRELAALAAEAVTVTRQYRNVGQADLPDLLAAEVEAAKAQVEAGEAGRQVDLAWIRLRAAVGDPGLAQGPLDGDLEALPPSPGRAAELAPRLARHPALAAAQAKAGQAEARVRLEQARLTPDLTFKVGAGYDLAPREDDREEGWKGFLEVRLPVAWFDDNRGAQAAAAAEARRAQALRRQLEQDLQARLEEALAREKALRERVLRYQQDILPRAHQAQAMYLRSYQGMTAAYSQALVSRRTWLTLKAEHAADLGALWGQTAHIQGLLDAVEGQPVPAKEALHGH